MNAVTVHIKLENIFENDFVRMTRIITIISITGRKRVLSMRLVSPLPPDCILFRFNHCFQKSIMFMTFYGSC